MPVLPSALLAAIDGLPVLQTLLAPAPVRQEELVNRVEALFETWMDAGETLADPAACALLRGGLLYAVDALDPAHAIFQEDPSPAGAYWHGMLHRREGDFWNAKYWLQRAGRLSALKGMPGFDPVQFVTRCERVAQSTGAGDPAELLAQQRTEWEHLMKAAYEAMF